MASLAIRKDEQLPLVLALAAHALLFAWLAWQRPAPAPPLPERMTVTLADEFGPISTSPEPEADPAPDVAPVLGESPPEPEAVAKPEPKPGPVPALKPSAKPTAAPKVPSKQPPKKGGASDFDSAFAPGTPGGAGKDQTKNQPATAIGPAVRSALAGAISRQLKPRWVAPQGIDAEKLVTVLSWDLNPDGSLASNPRVVSQEGINDANRAQAPRHAEQAIRAVKLAAPFQLPAEYYSGWKHIQEFRFDRKLSQ